MLLRCLVDERSEIWPVVDLNGDRITEEQQKEWSHLSAPLRIPWLRQLGKRVLDAIFEAYPLVTSALGRKYGRSGVSTAPRSSPCIPRICRPLRKVISIQLATYTLNHYLSFGTWVISLCWLYALKERR